VAMPGRERNAGFQASLPGMRQLPLGWFFVAVWAVVCVLLALAIMAISVLG
jgi:hypothetical protein